jgi:hypothetical protein
MTRLRLLTLVVLGMAVAVASTLEATSKRIHVTAEAIIWRSPNTRGLVSCEATDVGPGMSTKRRVGHGAGAPQVATA